MHIGQRSKMNRRAFFSALPALALGTRLRPPPTRISADRKSLIVTGTLENCTVTGVTGEIAVLVEPGGTLSHSEIRMNPRDRAHGEPDAP